MARYDTDGSSALAPNDPYNDMDGAEIRPSFRVIDGGKSNSRPASHDNSKIVDFNKAKNRSNNSASKDLLRNSENSALTKNEPTFGDNSPWKNSVSGRESKNNKKTGKGKGGFLKQKKGIAAMAIILSLMVGGGAFLGSSQSLIMPAVSSHGTLEVLNASAWPINSDRRLIFLDNVGSASRSSKAFSAITGFPSWLKKRFSTKESFSVSGDTVTWEGTNLNGNVSQLYKNDVEFRNDFDSTAYGRVISLQDTTNVDMMDSKFGVTGNAYAGYKQTGDAATDTASYRQTSGELFDGKTSTTASTAHNEAEEEVDSNGDKTGEASVKNDLQDTSSTRSSNKAVDAETIKAANDYIQGITKTVGKVVNYSCTVLRAATMVATTIAGVATYNYARDAISNYLEPMSKTMAGDGNEAPINPVLNRMTTPYTTKVDDLTDLKITGSVGDGPECNDALKCNSEGNLSIEGIGNADDVPTKEYTGAFTEGKNFVAMMTQTPYNKQEAAIHSFNRSLQAVITSLKAFNITNAVCAAAQGVIATVDLVSTVVGIGISLLPGGQVVAAGGLIWQGAKKLFFQLGIGVVLNFAVSSFMAFLVPQLAKTLFSTPDQDGEGIPGSERFVQALGIVGGQSSRRNNGGSLATKEQAVAYSKLNQEVIAREAEVDRMNRSPFDITSRNTFLGSIVDSLLPTTFTSGISPVQTIVTSTSSAIAHLTNSASADGENSTYLNTFGDCEYLKDTYGDDVAADIYCNPIILNDTSTLNTSIDDPKYSQIIDAALECDSNGKNCSVNARSNLARYISYCADRTSPFGVIDANILSEVEKGSVVLNAMPIVGNIVDIMNSADYEKNAAWSDGRMCYPETNPDWENEYKYYQLYMLDMHIAEQIGAFEDSEETGNINPITAYREAYAEAHPIDDSYAGYIARVSGITKEDAEGLLAVVQYYQYLQEYDASNRIAMDGKNNIVKNSSELIETLSEDQISFESTTNTTTSELTTVSHYVVYADIRNRNYAI